MLLRRRARAWVVAACAALAAGCRVDADYGGTGFRCDDGVCPPGFTCVNGRCVNELPDASAADARVADAPPDAAGGAPWCDAIYPFRRQLTAQNNAADPLPSGFQVYWLMDVEDLATPPPAYDSLHLFHTAQDGCTELIRVVDDSEADYEAIWVGLVDPIPAGANDSNYWLYYGNDASPSPPSDPALVFDFYEPFSSGTVPDVDWLIQGTPVVASGAAQLGNEDHILSMDSWGPGHAVDVMLVIPTYSPRFWTGFQRNASDFLYDPPWMIWYTESNATGPVVWPSILLGLTDTMWSGSMVAIDADRHIYNIDRLPDRVVFRYENYPATVEEHTLDAPFTDPLQFRFTNTGTAVLEVHMVRIRRTAYPLPSSVVGPEEMQ